MKRIFFSILFIALIFPSCKKLRVVHFHGRVTYKCDGSPISGINLRIGRVYDTGHTEGEDLGECVTDNNGHYSLTTDVSQSGNFLYYNISGLISPYHSVFGESNSNGTDVLIDMEVKSNSNINCHIKNILPFNSSDVLDTLQKADSATYLHFQTIVTNLQGSSVDTTLTFSASSDNYSILKYTFTKNNITTTQYDTITGGCFNSTSVDIFY